MASSTTSLGETKFRVARFEFCHDTECTFSTNLHLVVTTDHVELKRGNAIALSYTWGEFDRRPRCIGHRLDHTAVELELGAEWIIEDVITRLAMLCIEHDLCWIDQLCIPQKDEEIRAALASIPLIYQTLDVIALLPGSLCACAGKICSLLKAGIDEMADFSQVRAEMAMEVVQKLLNKDMDQCLNSCGLCSWFGRLWTRQELLYAQRIKVAWASDREAPCVKNPMATETLMARLDDRITQARLSGRSTVQNEQRNAMPLLDDEAVNDLSPYAANFYKKRLAESGDPAVALRDLYLEHIRFTERAVSSFSEFLDVDRYDSRSEQRAYITFIRFLNGMHAEKDVSYGSETDTQKRLKGFFAQVGRLGSLQRAATQQRDYVVAVWVDCPGYVLPSEFKNMSLSKLLEDALSQIEQKFGLSLAVCAPSGLFGASQRGALWQPSKYLDHIETETTRDVYGVLPRARNRPVRLNEHGQVGLQHLGPGAVAKSRAASEYRALCQGQSMEFVIDFMKKIIERWPGDVTERIMYSQKVTSRKYEEKTGPEKFQDFLIDHITMTRRDVDIPDQVRAIQSMVPRLFGLNDLSEAEHYEATYSLVANALGLDRSVCQGLGLQLAVGFFPSACIGLSAVDLGKNSEVDIDEFHDDDEVWTVCMLRGSAASGSCLIEVQRVPGDAEPPQFRVMGVWVASREVLLSEVSAVSSMHGSDGVIV